MASEGKPCWIGCRYGDFRIPYLADDWDGLMDADELKNEPGVIPCSGPQVSERWHTVTTDSATIYVWDDFKNETAKSRAQSFARDIGPKADYHREGSEDCEVWGCMAHLEPLYASEPRAKR